MEEILLKGHIETNQVGVQEFKIDVTDFVKGMRGEKKKDTGGASEIIAIGEEAEKLTEETLNNNLSENNENNNNQNTSLIDYSKFSYSGDLQNEPYKEIIAFQDGKIYLSYEGFSYFFIMCLVGIFVFRMFMKFCIFTFNLGFNYFVLGKK